MGYFWTVFETQGWNKNEIRDKGYKVKFETSLGDKLGFSLDRSVAIDFEEWIVCKSNKQH
jgi:hypothetical protein